MKMLLALRDVKTGSFLAPLTASTPGEAERTYLQILRREGTQVHEFPNDYPLYEIGKFDEFTGEVFPVMDGNRILPARILVEAAQVFPHLQKEGEA